MKSKNTQQLIKTLQQTPGDDGAFSALIDSCQDDGMDSAKALRIARKARRDGEVALRWTYNGDVNVVYGGAWFDLSTWNDGYVSAVRVTDLDSGCGFTGACMIEHVTVNGTTDPERIRQAMHSCGGGAGYHHRPEAIDPVAWRDCIRHMIADALMSYGYTDPDDCWDGFGTPYSEIVQLDPDGPMSFESWKVDKRLRGGDLKGYVEAVHLK